jgi:hypothetical protein
VRLPRGKPKSKLNGKRKRRRERSVKPNELLISRRFVLSRGERKKPKLEGRQRGLVLLRSLDLLLLPLPLHLLENDDDSLCNPERLPRRQQHRLSVFLHLRKEPPQRQTLLHRLLRLASSCLLLLEPLAVHLLGVNVRLRPPTVVRLHHQLPLRHLLSRLPDPLPLRSPSHQ